MTENKLNAIFTMETLEKYKYSLPNFLKAKAGIHPASWQTFTWMSIVKPLAAYKGRNICKTTTCVARLGVCYNHIAKVIAEKLIEDPNKVKRPGWAIAVKGYENYLLQHKDHPEKLYIRVSFDSKHKFYTTYTLDGKPITKKELISLGAISSSESNKPTVCNIPLEHMMNIGKFIINSEI